MHDKAKLVKALSRICAMQGKYGKTAAELETMVEGFCWVLAEYTTDQVIDAMGIHIKKSRDIPTPSDIEHIINPPPPKIDWAMYVSLKKKSSDGAWLLSDEREFVRNCENMAKVRQRGELEAYTDAQRQLTAHTSRLLDCGE